MSGHESHGHGGGHGDHGHGHKKEKPKPVTDDLMNELASKTHLSDESEALRKSLASGKLTPELEKEATKRIEHEERDKYVNQLARDRMLRIVKNTKKSKEILDKKIEDLEDALLEHGSAGSFRDLINAKIKDAEVERGKLEDILEKNKENIADIEVIRSLDDARAEYAKEFKKYHKGIKTKRRIENLKIGIFNLGTKFNNWRNKNNPDKQKELLKKKGSSEYETPEFQAKKEAYEVARLVLANRMYERRKKELMYVGAKTRDEAIKEIKKNNPAPSQHIETRDEAIEALKLEKMPVFKVKTKEKIVIEMKRARPSLFDEKTREAVIGEMLSEYETHAETLGYSREKIQEQLIEQEDRFRLGKYDDEIDARLEKELDAEIASGKYDTEINNRIAEDEKRLIDEYNKEQDDLVSKGKYDKEIEKRIKDSESSAKEAKEKFESDLEAAIKKGDLDSEIDRIRLESGQLDPAEQIKRLKQYKAKEILQKTFFDERKKVYEESGVPEKIAALRLWEWYAKQSPWKRRLLSTALFTAAGATGAMPFAAGMIAKYGIASYAGMKFGLSAITGGVVGNATKGIDLWNYKKDEEFKKEQARKRKESEDKFVNGEINQKKHEENLLLIEEDENKDRKKRMRIKSLVGIALGATTGALAYNIIDMPVDHDRVDPPLTKGHTFTKPEPVQLEKTLDRSVQQVEKITPIKSSTDQLSLNNNQNYEPYKILPREPAGPEIDMNPNRETLERGGPAITSDVTPAITADGIGPANSNVADQAPAAAEKPPYNFGDYNPEDRDITEYNKETGELTTKSMGAQKPEDLSAGDGKQLDLESSKPLEGEKVNAQTNNSQAGEQIDLESGKPLGSEKENVSADKPQTGEQLDLESGKQLDNTGAGERAPEAPDKTGAKAEGGTSTENTNTKSGLDNTAGQGSKIDYHETQKIQENQFQKIKGQIGDEEYEKLIKTLDNNGALYKTNIDELRTIAVGENSNESLSREIALTNAREQLREQAGLKDAVLNDRDPSRVITSQLPNGEFRTIVVQAAHHVNNIEVDDLFNTENIPVTAEENVKAIINQSDQNAERFMSLSGTDESTMKSILTPKDSNHIRIVSERTSPDLAKAREMIVNDRRALNKVMGDDSVSMVGNSMDRIFKDSKGDYHVYRIYEIKK